MGPLLKLLAEPVLEQSPQVPPRCTAVYFPLVSDTCSVTEPPPGCLGMSRGLGSGWADATGEREAAGKEPTPAPVPRALRDLQGAGPARRSLRFLVGRAHKTRFPSAQLALRQVRPTLPSCYPGRNFRPPHPGAWRLEGKDQLSGSSLLILGLHVPAVLRKRKTAPKKVAGESAF